MPISMGIHCRPIGHRHSASLDSHVRGNDGGMFFPRKRLRKNHPWILQPHHFRHPQDSHSLMIFGAQCAPKIIKLIWFFVASA